MSHPASSPLHRVFSLNLARIRVALGVTQKKMALGLGMGYRDYCLVERGLGEINLSFAERAAFLLGVRVFELFDPSVLSEPNENSTISRIVTELERLDDDGQRIILGLTHELVARTKVPQLHSVNIPS
jgi:transcriptional regulator with XRE-family HTH domain